MRILLFISAFLAFTSLTSQEKKYQVLEFDPLLTKNADAIVRLDKMSIWVISNQSLKYEVKQAVTVFNKKGDTYAKTRLFYDKEKKIKSIEAFVYDKFGKEIKRVKKKDFQDLSAADGFSLYNDDRLLYYQYTPILYPYTIEFNYKIETSDTGFFPPWYFISGYQVSVEKSHYEINFANESLRPEIKEYNLNEFDYQKKDTPNNIIYKAENIPAIRYEQLSPSFADIAPRLRVRIKNFSLKGVEATVTNWNDLGAWIDDKLLKNRDELPLETKRIIQGLVQGVDDTLEKAKIIYQYVQDNTRYISVQIGIGGWQPISAIEVDKVKYGDCKGLSNYTKALLNEVGVEAYYVVVHAGKAKIDFDEDFSVLQGNHAILTIPYQGEYYWIDCTSQVNPFGFIGDFTDDRNVLIIKPTGGEIVKTTSYLDDDNYQKTTGEIKLNADGSICADARILTKGSQYDNHFQLEQEPGDEVIKQYKDYWGYINNLKVNEYKFQNNKNEVVFTENVEVNAVNYASIIGDRIIFPVNVLNRNGFVPQRYRVRKMPFEIRRGFFDEDETKIEIPEDFTIEAIPEDFKLETQFGTYIFEIIKEEDALVYKRKLFVKHGLYSNSDYDAYRNFRKEIVKRDNSKIVLIKS